MDYREYPPHPRLREYVECYWTRVPSRGLAEKPHQVIPDGCIDILFRFPYAGSKELHAKSYVVGAMRNPLWVPPSETEIAAIRFRPGGAVPFLKVPALDLTDANLALDSFFGASGADWQDRLWNAGTHERVRLLERELLSRLPSTGPLDLPLGRLIRASQSAREIPTVETLASVSGISCRQLERKFQSQVGIGPKMLLRIFRFQRAAKHLGQPGRVDWAGLATENGYYDQAHLIRDFKMMTETSPVRYLARLRTTSDFSNTGDSSGE